MASECPRCGRPIGMPRTTHCGGPLYPESTLYSDECDIAAAADRRGFLRGLARGVEIAKDRADIDYDEAPGCTGCATIDFTDVDAAVLAEKGGRDGE